MDFKNGGVQIKKTKEKVDCPETVRWFLQRIWKFLFWTVWTLDSFGLRRMRCVRVNQLSQQNYCCHIYNTRAKLPNLSIMVFTDAIVNFTCNPEQFCPVSLFYLYIPHTKNQVLVLWYMLQDFYNLHIEMILKNKLNKKSFIY